jgi:hypothetical protein
MQALVGTPDLWYTYSLCLCVHNLSAKRYSLIMLFQGNFPPLLSLLLNIPVIPIKYRIDICYERTLGRSW